MKLHFIVAAAVALLCAAPIASAYDDADVVQSNVIEVEQEEGFLNQALNYLSEVEKTEEVLAETQSGKKSEGEDDKKSSSRSRSRDRDNKSRDKKDRAPSKKDREPRPTRKPKEDRTPKPTRKPKKERTPKPTREPKPTPKPTRRTRRPTRRPTRKPTISRSSQRAIDKWIHKEWSEDECDVRGRRRRLMSYRCKQLEDIVCTHRRRSLSREARDVCEKVGLPPPNRSLYTEDSEDLYSEDAAFDYDFMYVEVQE